MLPSSNVGPPALALTVNLKCNVSVALPIYLIDNLASMAQSPFGKVVSDPNLIISKFVSSFTV